MTINPLGCPPWSAEHESSQTRTHDSYTTPRDATGQFAPIEKHRQNHVHFSRLNHEQRVAAVHGIAQSQLLTVSVCVNKRTIDRQFNHGLEQNRRLYFYTCRLLLERISWLARQHHVEGQGNRQTRLVFSHCKKLSYDALRDYFRLLRQPVGPRVQIDWNYIDTEEFEVLPMHERVGLKAVDCVASGIRYGLDLSPYGHCEAGYATPLRRVTYHRNGNYLSYGLKFLPGRPALIPDQNNRYGWIAGYE